MDPITKQYPELTPYQFASNRPIDGVDMEGLEWTPPLKPDPDGEGFVVDGEAAMRIHGGKENLLLPVILVDIYVTKGWLSRIVFATEAASIVEHNTAKSPEGKKLQAERFKAAASNFAMSYFVTKIFGSVINVFSGPLKEDVKYLFRGTTEGYEGSRATQITQSTPTSSDPVVSTIFAVSASRHGNAVVQVASPSNLLGVEVGVANNVLNSFEKEIVVGLKPAEFTARTNFQITANESRGILEQMGIKLPSNIPVGEISNVIKSTPRLNPSQIDEFVKKANQLKKIGDGN